MITVHKWFGVYYRWQLPEALRDSYGWPISSVRIG
jgi:hypothetical protein